MPPQSDGESPDGKTKESKLTRTDLIDEVAEVLEIPDKERQSSWS
jgi:hypothetical protein